MMEASPEDGGGLRLGSRRRATVGLWLAAIGVSLLGYGLADELIHFGWHLAYGSAAGLLVGLLVARARGRAPRAPGLWALAGYAYMVVPDALWVLPVLWGGELWPHEAWMDVFLGHVALDHWAYASLLAVPTLLAAAGVWWWAANTGAAGSGA